MDSIRVFCDFGFTRRKVERVGLAFLNSKKCSSNGKKQERSELSEKLSENKFTVDIDYLKSLNPKEWKEQDHYAVLGLEKLRFHATEEDIRCAYRQMVLQHHPDKRSGEKFEAEDDYFTCITKAYEILGSSKTRRAYDSVDPKFDDSFPSSSEIEKDFYNSFNRCFKLNARWSERKNVPVFGDENAKREDVETFYNFWYDFKSWREFSYMDEEDKEKGQDRDERRAIEKDNKVARIKRKKEEMMRIRALVDLAYNNDKRIQKFKNEEKDRKLAAKRAKMDAVQAMKAEQERILKEAQLAKERADKIEQKRIEQIRIEKEQTKKALKRERKILRDRAKDNKYFSNNDKDTLKNMEGIENICEIFSLADLQELNAKMESSGKEAFFAALKIVEQKISVEKEEMNQSQQKRYSKNSSKESKNDVWSNENIHLLIKAVNLFPAGTSQRWDVVASFINQHSAENVNVNARDVLNKAKALQNCDFSKSQLKSQANDSAFQSFEKSKKDVQTCNDISINNCEALVHENNSAGSASSEGVDSTSKNGKPNVLSKAWSKEEQALLEQAIKTYPTSTPDRWDRIAECIPNRTKKDCLRRVKELVELVNSKKEAQLSVK